MPLEVHAMAVADMQDVFFYVSHADSTALLDEVLHISLDPFTNEQLLNSVIGSLHPRVSPHSTRVKGYSQLCLQCKIICYPDFRPLSDNSLLQGVSLIIGAVYSKLCYQVLGYRISSIGVDHLL
jgi:hypothetical protein